MRLLRGLAGALLWLLACVLGLVAVVLCITILLLPLGIPVLHLSRRLFQAAVKLMLPRVVSRPDKQAKKSLRRAGRKVRRSTPDASAGVVTLKRAQKRAQKRARKGARSGAQTLSKQTRRARKRLAS